jgi:phosphoglycerate dehydrogenase-like enzyme
VVGVPGLRNYAAMEEAVEDADVLIGLCTPEIIARGKNLRFIQLLNAGADSCTTIPEVAERGILVTNLQRIQGPHMAEHAIALTLALARALPQYGVEQAGGAWTRGFRERREEQLVELEGKTLLVVGLGGIGTEVAARAHGLGMRVIATRNSRREGPDYVEYVGLADEYRTLAARADVVVNATPLTADTRGMFDAAFFDALKVGAFFINIGRGESVDTAALVAALQRGQVSGAGLDVTDPEPLPPGHPLWSMRNVIITPHIATSSDVRSDRTLTLVVENVRRYMRGDALLSVVDLALGY